MTLLNGLFLIILFLKAISAKHLFKKSLQPDAVFLSLVLLSIMLALIVNIDFAAVNEYIRIFIIIISAFLISRMVSFGKFIYYFTRMMRLVTFISLLLFIIIKYTDIIFPVIKNGTGVKYYSVYIFSTDYTLYHMNFYRNSAIFWEAGLFAAFIMLAFIMEIAYITKTKTGFIVFSMYLIALISTGSTSACLYAVLAIFLLLSLKAYKFWSVLLLLISLAAVLYFIINFNEIISVLALWKPEIFRKIISKNSSFTDRFNNPIADMLVCFHHPFGCGVGNLTALSQFYAMEQFGTVLFTRTSTLTYFFAAFGYFGGLVYNCAWIARFIKMPDLKLLTKILMIISVIILATSSPLNTNMTFWMMLFVMLNPPVQRAE